MKKQFSTKNTLKKSLAILCMLLIGFTAAGCRKDEEKTPAPDNSADNNSSSFSGEPETEKPKPEGQTPEGLEESLPAVMVVTPYENSPVSEINAKWSKEIRLSKKEEPINFDNGDFAQVRLDYSSNESGVGSEESIANKAVEILRYNGKGTLLWEKTFEDIFFGGIYVTQPLSDNSLLLLTDIDYTRDSDYTGHSNGLLTKISKEGDIVWSRTLTHNYEYFDWIFEMPNGEFYTAGNFNCDRTSEKVSVSAKMRWWHPDTDAETRVVLARWDKEGNLLDYILPEYGLISTDAEYVGTRNHCVAKYKEGVGFLVDFGTCLVCYDENFKEKWVYKFEKMAITDEQWNAGYYQVQPGLEFADNLVRNWFHPSVDKAPARIREVSFSGKLITDRPATSNEREFYSPFLPDGRQIVKDNEENIKTRVSFILNGKITEFDSFETEMGIQKIVPTIDGGFFIEYFVYSEGESDERYSVITKYNAEGRTEIQRVFNETFTVNALRGGVIAIQNDRTAN